MSSPRVRLWYALLVSFIACLVVAMASVAYASWVNRKAQERAASAQQESDRRWCALLTNVSQAQRDTPPKTDSGKSFAAEIDRLRRDFGCPEPQ